MGSVVIGSVYEISLLWQRLFVLDNTMKSVPPGWVLSISFILAVPSISSLPNFVFWHHCSMTITIHSNCEILQYCVVLSYGWKLHLAQRVLFANNMEKHGGFVHGWKEWAIATNDMQSHWWKYMPSLENLKLEESKLFLF